MGKRRLIRRELYQIQTSSWSVNEKAQGGFSSGFCLMKTHSERHAAARALTTATRINPAIKSNALTSNKRTSLD